jgi:hypothetical protein
MYSLQKTKPSHTFQKIRPTRQESPFKKGFFDSLLRMLQVEFSHDTFGMLSFLRLIGLRINDRMLKFLGMNQAHKILCV